MPSSSDIDPVKKAATEIAILIHNARVEEAEKQRIALEKAQWESEQLRNEGILIKEKLMAEIQQLKRQLAEANNKVAAAERRAAGGGVGSSGGGRVVGKGEGGGVSITDTDSKDLLSQNLTPPLLPSKPPSSPIQPNSQAPSNSLQSSNDHIPQKLFDIVYNQLANDDPFVDSHATSTTSTQDLKFSSFLPKSTDNIMPTEQNSELKQATPPPVISESVDMATSSSTDEPSSKPEHIQTSAPADIQPVSSRPPSEGPSPEEEDEENKELDAITADSVASLATAVATAIKEATPTHTEPDKVGFPASASTLAPPAIIPGKSRGRGGDRPSQSPTATLPVTGQPPPQVMDPTNPYLVVHANGAPSYAAFHPGMAQYPGFPHGMVHHNPYMMFPPMMHARAGAPGTHPMLPLGFPIDMSHPHFQQHAAAAAAAVAAGESSNNANGETENGANGEASTSTGGTPANPTPVNPSPYPPGHPLHHLPPAFHPPTDHNGQPLPYHHLLPTLHHPHGPPGTAIQLTLPLAVADHTLPSHLDALIRAPDSLTISYSEVPDGAYLLRTDFGEGYPKQLEPPRKTTEMRCLFCKRHYSGPNARGMWRRHVTGKHDFVFERKGKEGSGSRRPPLMPGMITNEDPDGDMDMADSSFIGDQSVLQGAQKMEGEDDGGEKPGDSSKVDGQSGAGVAVAPSGRPEDMSMVSLNGMPIHGMGIPMPGFPPGAQHMHQMPMQIHMLGNPPHPMLVPPPPPERKRGKPRSSNGVGGVGMGNGGGGIIPRVHPLLSKEERIERARASKRHYAMKRRAIEKMKAGGIPKGAKLVDGVFILADGTQIPAEPGKVYTDLSAHAGGSGGKRDSATGADDMDEDDEDGAQSPPRKRRRSSRRKAKQDEDDEKDEDDEMIEDELADVSMAEAGEDGEAGELVPMDQSVDPWSEHATVYPASAIPLNQTPINPATGLPWTGKLAEVPFVTRGYKPPSVPAAPVPKPSTAAPPPDAIVAEQAPSGPNDEEEIEPKSPAASGHIIESPPSPQQTPSGEAGGKRKRGRPTNAAREAAAAAAAEKADRAAKRKEKRMSKKIEAQHRAEQEEDDEIIDDDDDEEERHTDVVDDQEAGDSSIPRAVAEVVEAEPAEEEEAVVKKPATRTSTRRVSVRGKNVAAPAPIPAPAPVQPEGVEQGDDKMEATSSLPRRRRDPPGGLGGDGDKTFCYCEDHEYGNMIGCDNPDCPREWFHLNCTDIKGPIPSSWYCNDCRGGSAAVAAQPAEHEHADEAEEESHAPASPKAKVKTVSETRGRGRGRARTRGRGRGRGASTASKAEEVPAATAPKGTGARGKGRKGKGRPAKEKGRAFSPAAMEPESEDDVYESEDQGGEALVAASDASKPLVDEDYDELDPPEEEDDVAMETDGKQNKSAEVAKVGK